MIRRTKSLTTVLPKTNSSSSASTYTALTCTVLTCTVLTCTVLTCAVMLVAGLTFANIGNKREVFGNKLEVVAQPTNVALRADAVDDNRERRPWLSSNVRGTPTPPYPYRVELAFKHLQFRNPTCLVRIPGTRRLLVTQNNGQIFSFENDADSDALDLVVDLRDALRNEIRNPHVPTFHATFHPQFETNRLIYVCYVYPGEDRHTRVSSFELSDDEVPTIDAASEEIIITWLAGGHNGGCLSFGPDGYLYISTGDGSGPNPPDGLTTGQDVTDLLGAILRIDVDAPDQPYRVPADNPFVGDPSAREEIWGYGLRNPFKYGIDAATGDLFVADNGWESWEMVHRVQKGTNSGWPVMEGRVVLRSEVPIGPTEITPPIKDHSHSEANSVIGGPVYREALHADLDSQFVYGDYITGTIWSLTTDATNYEHRTLAETDLRIVAFGLGDGGELFVVDYDLTGQIYELVPSEIEDLSADFPRRLSETGIFSSTSPLTPADGVMPYEVVVDRWLDGMEAQRWIAIPEDGVANINGPDRERVFPDGTVLVKHITSDHSDQSYPIETQILHFEHGVWNPYSYLWELDGSDARLVDAIGISQPLSMDTDQSDTLESWHVGAQNECRLCHNAGSGYVLGFQRQQVDVRESGASFEEGQLARLMSQRVIAEIDESVIEDEFQLCNPNDQSFSIENRARSYLHGNCAMCHHRGGNAIVSFYLHRSLPFEQLNTNKGSGIGTFGMDAARVIAPGDPFRSILLYRMSKIGYSRMPYIGSHHVDSQAVGLVRDWIADMEPIASNDSTSAPARMDSDEASILDRLSRDSGSSSQQQEMIRRLLESTEGTLALATQMHSGKLKPETVEMAVSIGVESENADRRGLFEAFLPESKRRRTLGPNANPDEILALEGNIERGELIFFSDDARCRNCHDHSDPNKSLGPTLNQIVNKYPGRVELLRQILEPARAMEARYRTYSILTIDGRIHTGLLVRDRNGRVVIKNAQQELIELAREDIEEMNLSDQSLMPERLLSDLTAQEAADLISYLHSLRSE